MNATSGLIEQASTVGADRKIKAKETCAIKPRMNEHGICRSGEGVIDTRYGVEWEGHVLANLPMWMSLLPLFLDQTLARVSSYGDPALCDLLSVRYGFCTTCGVHCFLCFT